MGYLVCENAEISIDIEGSKKVQSGYNSNQSSD
jgi:hypothetical protein